MARKYPAKKPSQPSQPSQSSSENVEDIETIDLTGDDYECDICHKEIWVSETDVEIHRKDVHKALLLRLYNEHKNEVCGICVRPQGSLFFLKRHIKTEHLLSSPISVFVEREIFFCDICEALFFNKKLLAMHIAYTHSSKLYKSRAKVECAICSKDVRIQTGHLWSHFYYHNFMNIATCKICLKSCPNKEELKIHMTSHSTYERCSFCNFSAYVGKSMDEHVLVCHRKLNSTAQERGPYMRFFMRRKAREAWKLETNINGIKGMMLPENIAICVMCREICSGEKEMKRHIEFDHLA